MRGFAMIFLMVMVVFLMAPMTVMAGGMGHAPVLAITMEIWSDVVTAKARVGPESKLAQLRENFILIDYAMIGSGLCSTTEEGSGQMTTVGMTTSDISATTRAMDGKAGGGAAFASGKPVLSPSTIG